MKSITTQVMLAWHLEHKAHGFEMIRMSQGGIELGTSNTFSFVEFNTSNNTICGLW